MQFRFLYNPVICLCPFILLPLQKKGGEEHHLSPLNLQGPPKGGFFFLGDSGDCRQSTFNAHNALFLYWRLAFRPLEAFPLPPIQKSALGRLLDGLAATEHIVLDLLPNATGWCYKCRIDIHQCALYLLLSKSLSFPMLLYLTFLLLISTKIVIFA